MDEFVRKHIEMVIDQTIKALEQNGFGARFFSTREEAAKFIMDEASDCKTVGIAGTHTVRALGVVPMLEQAGKTMFDHWKLTPGTPEEFECRRNQMLSDLFLTGSSAVTMTGEIVNRDGAGNRVNALTFGPKKAIVVIGRNKITPNLDSALARIEETSAPIRAMSLGRKTPCTATGECMDCDSPERICRITSIIHRRPMMSNITVVILDEDLGY